MSNVLSPQTSFFEKKSTLLFFALLIIAVTLFRFWYATQLELIGDEAYYWYCSRHLDWSFFDKGPGAAVTIWLGTHLFGDTVFGVRFFAVLLSAATGIALLILARLLFSERVAFWTLLIALFMPLYAVGSILMTIDPLSIFFWTLATITFWCAIKNERVFLWILTGAFVGLGMLAKYTNLVELLCFALFCFWCRDERRQFKRPHFYFMLATTCCFALPIVIWNIEHHWIGVVHLIHRGDLDHSWSVKPGELLTFLGAQAGVISPFFFLGVIVSVFWPQCDQEHKKETCYLRSLFIPLFFFYSCLSLNKAAEPNWTAPCYVAGMVLLAGNWSALQQHWSLSKKWVVAAFMIAAFETVMLHNTWWLHVPISATLEANKNPIIQKIGEAYRNLGAVDPLDRARGPESIAQHALGLSQKYKTQFFISDNYQTASLLSFYLPGHPDTYEADWGRIKDQFSIWPGYKQRYALGSKAIFIFEWPYSPEELRRDFSEVREVDQSYSMTGTRPIKKYYYSVCNGLNPQISY
ncbi:MAG: glycosyltransferase family 39 protein [Verrucomicrobia bacterium]|nr:glycosyltransferase family 39 protein [Verrucomicrobiota bacterium]